MYNYVIVQIYRDINALNSVNEHRGLSRTDCKFDGYRAKNRDLNNGLGIGIEGFFCEYSSSNDD